MPPPDPDSAPDLGDWGASVTVDTGGNLRQVTANVAGHGPFVHEPGAGAPTAAAHGPSADDERLRHDIDLLQEAIERLRSQHDAADIAHASVTVFCAANAAVHHGGWNESEGLAEETRHWTAVTGTEGAADSFEAARESIVTSAEHVVAVLHRLFDNHDLVGRAIELGSRGGEALTHLAQTAAHARGCLSFTTTATLRLLDEALTLLESATGGERVLRETLTVLSMTSHAMVGPDEWAQGIADEYREWVSLTERSGTADQFTQARDQVLAAARDARRDIGAHVRRRMDAGTVARIAPALTHVAQQARALLHAD